MSPTGGRVVRHRFVRLRPAHWRALLVIGVILAIGAPAAIGSAALADRRTDDAARAATWIVPTRIEPEPDPLAGTDPHASTGPPTRLRIAPLGVDTSLESLGLEPTGELQSPRDYSMAGWYAAGTAPGEPGPAVVAGHVDSRTGPAVFFRLHELRPGARIDVERGGRWLSFQVTATERHAKATFPSARVYGPTPGAELRLITCGGVFDTARNSYRENVVVYAVLA